ncbi:DUF6174 domain-containing protein [Streptomyces sp. NPDC001759]
MLVGTVLCATAACGSGELKSATAPSTPAWQEPESYDYTLTSATSVLAGTFRVKVRDGEVVEAVGLDKDSKRQAHQVLSEVPTIKELLRELVKARGDDADTADAEYAADGRPLRITLDWDKNAIDDEAMYVISSFRVAAP